ncbi:hypothetical protein OIY81_272 [Cryptosporidium canis]|nr:hypothetical protein OIY81_272 [Cryptosporidium canis]
MQSIIKNAFDKVSVFKDVVGNTLEEAVKSNTRDSSYVFNSGSSISSSIVNWAEKNHVSEKANNIKMSASLLVGDLATGLKGMTNNISIQNNIVSEISKYQYKSHQEKQDLDCFSGGFGSSEYIDEFYCNEYRSDLDIHSKEGAPKELNPQFLPAASKTKTSRSSKNIDLNLSDVSDNLLPEFGGLNSRFDYLNCDECESIERSNTTKSVKDGSIDTPTINYKNIEYESINIDNKQIINVGHENTNFKSPNQSIIGSVDKDHESLNGDRNLNDSTPCSSLVLGFEHPESALNANSGYGNYSPEGFEDRVNSKSSSQSNPLSVFQKISKLEDQNSSLKIELEQLQNESAELKDAVSLKTRTINLINSRISKLEIEKETMNNYIIELEKSQAQYKSKIVELEHVNINLKRNEDINKEYQNTIKSLEEKILELENSLAINEANKEELLKAYQNEISELRIKMSDFKEKESNISKPYISRIGILEHQLGEIRKRHSSELQRFEMIIDELKSKSAKYRSENEILERNLQEINSVHQEMIEKYDLRISQYKNIVDQIENSKISQLSVTKPKLEIIKDYRFSICKVSKVVIDGKAFITGEPSHHWQLTTFLKPSIISISNNPSNSSILNPLKEEIKQTLHDKKLLEDEYFSVCEQNKQIGEELIGEKQRTKLLQQQLDSMFKLINDLNIKLNESKRS